uniref:ABC transporter permease n=1 Tax=Streptomyces sp. NBC_00049 TaxID=2903617 RepID=A0AAU2JYY5_9ACTN
MSALTLGGPRWVTVRQHRRALWAAAAAIAVSLAVVAPLTLIADDQGPGRPYQLLRSLMDVASGAMLLLPLLVGAFVAGPMVARELESGTYRLALAQSTTPQAWLGAKVAVAAAVTAAGTAALIGVYRLGWVRMAGSYQFHWSDRGTYEATGPVLVAYGLLAVAVGALVGQLVRRTIGAMAVTALVTGLVLAVFGYLRWSVLPVRTVVTPPGTYIDFGMPRSAFFVDSGYTTATGERLSSGACFVRSGDPQVCPTDMNVTGNFADFHPASHYWPTQLIETSAVLVLAALALYAALRVLRARHG